MYKPGNGIMQNQADFKTEKIFLSNVSHRIRTPLNSVIGFSKLLLDKNMDAEKVKLFAERILDSGYEILNYFQNIMDLSEIESGMITITPAAFELNNFYNSLTRELAERFKSESNINIFFSEAESGNNFSQIHTDEFWFKRIQTNLIELARNYISDIRVSYVITDNNEVITYVKGIAEKKISNPKRSYLFNEQIEKDAEQNGIEYLTYKVINKLSSFLKGQFHLEKCDENGVVFSFRIPMNPDNTN